MVGVAGKSKGCATCRRRRIKCDEAQPSCQRCRRSNIKCEGYERFPVFIDRTQSGLRKRLPLEEAKLATVVDRRIESPGCCVSPLVLSLRSPATEAILTLSWFREHFARSAPSKRALLSPPYWLDLAMDLPHPRPVLQGALLATSLALCGKVNQVQSLRQEGRRHYARSLSLLNLALSHKDRSLQDDILATTGVMSLYELVDSFSQSQDACLTHISGILRLLELRGPRNHREAVPRAMLEHFRYVQMMQQLTQRRGSILNQPCWLVEPWEGSEPPKSPEQRVFDYGLQLGSLFERSDQSQCFNGDLQDLTSLLEECAVLVDGIRRCRYTMNISGPYGPAVHSRPTQLPTQSPQAVFLGITAMGIHLGACNTGCDIFNRILDRMGNLPIKNEAELKEMQRLQASALNLCRQRRELAIAIVNAARLCLQEQRIVGLVAVRLAFALQQAILQFESPEPEHQQILSLLERLTHQSQSFSGLLKPTAF